MQRKLAYALSPAPGLPLRFLLTAPWFALLAGLVLLAAGPGAFASRWSPPLLAATHLLTLGYLTMAMAGSMLQLIPVLTGTGAGLGRAGAALAWAGLGSGALLLAAALGLNAGALFMPAAAVLAAAFLPLIACLARALMPAAAAAALPVVRGMRIATLALSGTVAMGLAMAAFLGGGPTLQLLTVADLHAAWGLVGWVAMLVACVGFQVIPMFQSTPLYPAAAMRWTSYLLAALLAAWSVARVAAPDRAALPGAALALALVCFAALSAWLLSRAKGKAADATTLYWRLSFASLAASALLWVLPGETAALAGGIVFASGFAMGAVNGMLYKIVPFLLWYHLQQDPRAGKGDVPPIRAIIADAQARRQFWWHAAAVPALAGAVLWPQWLARPAGALLAVASALLAIGLARAAWQCRAMRRKLQPS